MPRILWIYAHPDPASSGELRRLGLPALAMEGDDWSCEFVHHSLAGFAGEADAAVVPLEAANALPSLGARLTANAILEVDVATVLTRPDAAAVLAGLSNRIAGVVARGARAAAWASRVVGGGVPVWLIPDPAVRQVELAAAALRFGVPSGEKPFQLPPEAVELWFCEPGDHVDPEEVVGLLKAWPGEDPRRLVVAPAAIRAWLAQAGVRAAAVEWSPLALRAALEAAERCVFAGGETYAQCRRRVTALRSGAPATPPSAPAAGLFEPARVASAWQEALSLAQPTAPAGHATKAAPINVLIFLDLLQDYDPVLSLLDDLRRRPEATVRVAMTNWVRRRSPRVVAGLSARGVAFDTSDRPSVIDGQAPALQGVDAVVAAAESSLPAHERTHALFQRARRLGIPTFSIQHGVENVGLHHIPGEDDVYLAADYLFVWFHPDRTPPSVPVALRPRLVHVGRASPPPPELSDISGVFAAFDSVVVVFENLHWNRYDHFWRQQFLTDCAAFAFADASRAVVLKPHHAGLWTVKHRHLIPQWPSNLIVADPTDAFWEPFTAAALVRLADAVITTPSTAALDAVQAGKPVAVGAYGLDLPGYAPLPLLQGLSDWHAFAAEAGSIEDARRRATFLAWTTYGDRPAQDAADYLLTVARERRERRLSVTRAAS